ncbi:MAG: decarboxylating 6-phosphogluconate dehydrogenase [Actinobacteria bacterium]|nr:decarboxylating 6-phosphogluconate dehydrogenase [Actinomycetota bacterium]MBV8597971.1 decarboxylating 6-phosphogluconate dehydrogenase [Actinomycetota bacterium]
MQLGMIGLGRMGGNMAIRLREAGHDVKSYDPNVDSTAASLAELRDQLDAPRAFWMMVRAGDVTEQTFRELLEIADPGDTIVDGGNSNFRDSQRRHADAAEHGIEFVDVGVSGGVWGLEVGYCLMAGGNRDPVARLEPLLLSLAPEDGYAHVGGPGAGHFVKMVHNGIEYGLMQSYAEGFDVMKGSEFGLDLEQIAGIWRYGSVVRSWLLELLHAAFEHNGSELASISGYVEDSGEGRWTIAEAIAEDVPVPVITAALFARFASRRPESFAAKVNAALRNQFGGHAVRAVEQAKEQEQDPRA